MTIPVGTDPTRNQKKTMDANRFAAVSDSPKSFFT